MAIGLASSKTSSSIEMCRKVCKLRNCYFIRLKKHVLILLLQKLGVWSEEVRHQELFMYMIFGQLTAGLWSNVKEFLLCLKVMPKQD